MKRIRCNSRSDRLIKQENTFKRLVTWLVATEKGGLVIMALVGSALIIIITFLIYEYVTDRSDIWFAQEQQKQQQELKLADDILYRVWSQKHQDVKITRDEFDILKNTGKLDKIR